MKRVNITKHITTHTVFITSIVFKGLDGVLEIVGGFTALFVSQHTVMRIVELLVKNELLEDPSDIVANILLHAAGTNTPTGQVFVSLYLLSHGILKVFLVYNLFKHKTWAYPLAMGVFAIFAISQTIVYLKSPSVGLLVLTILDLVIIGLTYLEYKNVRKRI
jgi:uncharacterized membrane protein